MLGSVGAWLAVLVLIIRNTILSFLASIQISTQELIKDGDWIEVPCYDASGTVIDINLDLIKIQNFDNMISVIPTYKVVDVAYKNWRAMQESGGRRMSLSIIHNIKGVSFCDIPLLESLTKYDLITDYLREKIRTINDFQLENVEAVDYPFGWSPNHQRGILYEIH